MNLIEAFENEPWSKMLGMRRRPFMEMIRYLDTVDPGSFIIETGTIRTIDNWEGDGQSTRIWDWVAARKQLNVISIDLVPSQIDVAKSLTNCVHYIEGDSVRSLNNMPIEILNQTRLLYLDSFDWNEQLNFDSAFHHMMELASVWAHLPKGCLVAVDDRMDRMKGKHWMVEAFMEHLECRIAFRGYQIGWYK